MESNFETEKKSKKWEKPLLRNILTGAILMFIVIASFLLILNKDMKISELTTEKSNLNALIESRDSVINDLDGTISEIEENITFIKTKRGQLELEQIEGGPNQKERIIEDIALMNTMLEESEKKIDELNQKLASSNVELSSFKNRIAKLSSEIKEQNGVVVRLQQELEQKNFQLAELDMKVNQMEVEILEVYDSIHVMNDTIIQKSEKLQQMDEQLHKAYWTYGTFKELKEQGVITSEGGVLGLLGRSKTLNKNLNEDYFTALDIRNTQTIPLYTKKAEIISEHADNSYRFVYQNDQIAYLEIEDPDEFWKLTKYAVIEVK